MFVLLPDETATLRRQKRHAGVHALHPLHSFLRITCCKVPIDKVISYVGMLDNADFHSGIKGVIRLEDKVGRWLIETEEQEGTGNYP